MAHFLACFFYLIIDKSPSCTEDNWMCAIDPVFLDLQQVTVYLSALGVEGWAFGFRRC